MARAAATIRAPTLRRRYFARFLLTGEIYGRTFRSQRYFLGATASRPSGRILAMRITRLQLLCQRHMECLRGHLLPFRISEGVARSFMPPWQSHHCSRHGRLLLGCIAGGGSELEPNSAARGPYFRESTFYALGQIRVNKCRFWPIYGIRSSTMNATG